MARFLFTVCPERSHIYPSLPIALELRATGHAVGYVTLPEFRPLLEQYGIAYYPLEDDAPAEAAATPLAGDFDRRHLAREMFRRWFILQAPLQARAVERAAGRFGANVLIHDHRTWGPSLVAEQHGVPLATLSISCCSLPGENLAPFGLGLQPARDDATRAKYAALRAEGEEYLSPVAAEWNGIRALFGLPPHTGPLSAAAFSHELLILLGIPELDYLRDDLPAYAHYVGPSAWDPPSELDPAIAAWMARLDAQQPLVLVSASTASLMRRADRRHPDRRSTAMIDAVLQGLTGKGMAILATMPSGTPLEDLRESLPDDEPVHLTTAPHTHLHVLPRTAVVVTHGGIGTVTKALSFGRPLVIIPYGFDQPEVAERVVASGAGIRLDPTDLTPELLYEAVMRVSNEEEFKQNALRLSALMAQCNGPANAAALLVQLAGANTADQNASAGAAR